MKSSFAKAHVARCFLLLCLAVGSFYSGALWKDLRPTLMPGKSSLDLRHLHSIISGTIRAKTNEQPEKQELKQYFEECSPETMLVPGTTVSQVLSEWTYVEWHKPNHGYVLVSPPLGHSNPGPVEYLVSTEDGTIAKGSLRSIVLALKTRLHDSQQSNRPPAKVGE